MKARRQQAAGTSRQSVQAGVRAGATLGAGLRNSDRLALIQEQQTKQAFAKGSRGDFVRAVIREKLPGILEPLAGFDAVVEVLQKTLKLVNNPEDFRPEDPITRAEALMVLNRAWPWEAVPITEIRRSFSDVPPSHWGAEVVYGAAKVGIVQGFGDGSFKPNGFITGEVGGTLIARAANSSDRVAGFDPTRGGPAQPGGVARNQSDDAAAERLQTMNAAIDNIDVTKHPDMQPEGDTDKTNGNGVTGETFCNVYAVELAKRLGVFIPEYWWSDDLVARAHAERGEFPTQYMQGEMSFLKANDLFDWFPHWGHYFGWMCLGDAVGHTFLKGQELADAGRAVFIAGKRDGVSGHISAIVAQDADGQDSTLKARGEGIDFAPVQSQAGSSNFQRSSYGDSWELGPYSPKYLDAKVWVHM